MAWNNGLPVRFPVFFFPEKMKIMKIPIFFLRNGLTLSEKNNTMETDVMSVIMATKRIHNPVTGKYYELRQRSTVNGEAGQIKGLWSSKKKARR